MHDPSPHANDNDNEGRLSGVRVMMIDDEPDTLELLAMILSREGAVIAHHCDPTQLLEDWDRFAPNVLLSDIEMPRLNGHALLHRIRGRANQCGEGEGDGGEGGQVPAIAMTADRSGGARTRALMSGFAQLITKPIDIKELVAGIRTVVPKPSQT